MSIDAIGNFLTIIRNGLMASKPFVIVPCSKIKIEITRILKEEGFIRDFSIEAVNETIKNIKIQLKYVDNESVIHEITRKSRPSRRYYSPVNSIRPVIGGLGLSILTTSRGVLTNKQAKEFKVGGEVICTVW